MKKMIFIVSVITLLASCSQNNSANESGAGVLFDGVTANFPIISHQEDLKTDDSLKQAQFRDTLVAHILSGKLIAYSSTKSDKQLTANEVREMIYTETIDTTVVINVVTGEEEMKITIRKSENMDGLKFTEDWVINNETGKVHKKISRIDFMKHMFFPDGTYIASGSLFYVKQ